MSQTNLHPMLNIAVKAARAAGSIISRASMDVDRLTVTSKGSNDFVTEVDQAAEQIIIETLLQAYPGHGILAEESGREHGAQHSDYVWIIDPLDGTTNFIHGLPQYAVSIALAHKGRVEQAVVYDPAHNDLFYATKGKGAFLNDRRLRVSKRTRMLEALIGTGFPFRKGDNFKRYMKMFEEVMQACAGLRRPGSAALDLCYVAAGWYDGFFETGLAPWDVAAGSLIVTEAGGLVGNFTGEADFLHQREVLAGNPKIYAQLVQMLSPYSRVINPDELDAGATDAKADVAVAALAAAVASDATPAAASAPKKAVRIRKADTDVVAAPVASPAAPAAEAPAAAPADDEGDPVPWAAREIPLSPAQALAAAFDPTPPAEEAPAPVVVRKPVRIRRADLPPAEETEPAAAARRPRDERPRDDRPARPARAPAGASGGGGFGDRGDRADRPPRGDGFRSDGPRGPAGQSGGGFAAKRAAAGGGGGGSGSGPRGGFGGGKPPAKRSGGGGGRGGPR
jgi:myo-inositol-1(or 4)-monophosphatase